MRICGPALLLSALAGCAPAAPSSQATGAIIDVSSPWQEPGVVNGAMPELGVHGFVREGSGTDAKQTHSGVFSNGTDLSALPVEAQDPGCLGCDWAAGFAAPTPNHRFSPALQGLLGQALHDADVHKMPELDTGLLHDILGIIRRFSDDPNVAISESPLRRTFLGYPAELGRWMRSFTSSTPVTQVHNDYADPTTMAGLRERGARLYCAARTAQAQQSGSTKSMGKLTALSLDLFGKTFEFFSIEPTVVIDGPQRYLGAPGDGAQAFMVPLLYGVQLTPTNLLPPLPEFRYPVVLVSGDSELLTTAHQGNGQVNVSEQFQTAAHVDAIVGADGGGSVGAQKTLFYVGPIAVNLKMGIGLGIGQLQSMDAVSCPTGSTVAPGLPGSGPLLNDRLLDAVPAGWPTPARTGDFTGLWNDGDWTLSGPPTANITQFLGFTAHDPKQNMTFSGGRLQPWDPMLIRTLEDDDRHVYHGASIGICAQLSGELGKQIGPLNFKLTAGGGIGGGIGLHHDLRDAVLALDNDALAAQSTLSLEPSVGGQIDAGFFVHLLLQISLDIFPLGTQTFTIVDNDIVKLTLPSITFHGDPWEEPHRLRLGTGSASGDPLKQPLASSHLPNGATFSSFPQSIDSCLAGNASNPPAPPTCAPQTTPQAPARANVCLFTGGLDIMPRGLPGALPANVCSNISGFAAKFLPPPATDARRKCVTDLLTFLCAPTSKEQIVTLPELGSFQTVARIAMTGDANDPKNPINDPAFQAAMKNVAQECVQANLTLTPSSVPAVQSYVGNMFEFAPCDDTATVFATPVSGSGSSTVAPGSCQ
jgi:hypothetical protein